MALLLSKNQLALSFEAYAQELEARRKENAATRTVISPELNEQLLDNNETQSATDISPTTSDLDSHEHIIDVDSPTSNQDYRPARQEQISVAPSATLFGANNPANPNSPKITKKMATANDRTIDPTPLLSEVDSDEKKSMCLVM